MGEEKQCSDSASSHPVTVSANKRLDFVEKKSDRTSGVCEATNAASNNGTMGTLVQGGDCFSQICYSYNYIYIYIYIYKLK